MLSIRSLTLLLAIFVATVSTLHAGDKNPAPTNVRPEGKPDIIKPERQTESHTCGLHSMRSLYKSYRLPVDDYNLRARIGVDKPAVPFIKSTKGSIHPDLLRVLDQDGFKYEVVNMKADDVHLKLINHLKTKHYAMALLKLNNGVMHWVIVSEAKDNSYVIIDSLKTKAHKLKQTEFEKPLIGVLLIQPQKAERSGTGKSHRTGLWEGLKSLFR